MSKLRVSLTVLAMSVLASCVVPTATRGDLVWLTKPAEAQQYSDVLIGRYASLTDDPHLAAKKAHKAALFQPDDSFLLDRAVAYLLYAGETETAVKLAKAQQFKVRDIRPVTRLVLAADLLRKERFKEARSYLTNGRKDVFNRVVARSLAAWAAAGEGDLDGAQIHIIETLVGDSLLDGVNLNMKAFLQFYAGDSEGALEVFEAVWNERMRLAIACDQYARILANTGQRDKAIEVTAQFRNEIGPNPAIDQLRADLIAGKEIDPGIQDPRLGAALSIYALGAVLAAERDGENASLYYHLAMHIAPELDVIRAMLADNLDRSDRRAEALRLLKDIKSDSPFYPTSRAQMAWTLLRMERDAEGLQTALKAYETTQNRDLAIQIGDIYRALEDLDSAFNWFDKVVTEDEASGISDWRSYFARGVTYDALEKWPEAEADLQKALEISPNSSTVLNYLGYSWVDREIKIEEAFELIQKAVELEPESGHIVDSLGWAYYRLGRYQEAVQHLEKAVSLAPGEAVIGDHLGDAYWRSGRRLEARYQWQHALALEPEEELADQLRAKIESGLNGHMELADSDAVAHAPTE